MTVENHGPFETAEAAVEFLATKGKTHHEGTGECGDYGYGSRLYYCAPDTERNEFGAPVPLAATASYVCGKWVVAVYS